MNRATRNGRQAPWSADLRAAQTSIARNALSARSAASAALRPREAEGVPLVFTAHGAAGRASRLLPVAERADDSYQTARVASAVGMIGSDGTLEWIRRLHKPWKVEGITARRDGRLLLVTDADDARVPAGLYSAALPGRPVRSPRPPSRR